MDADEDGILARVRDPGAQFEGHEDIAITRHFHIQPFRLEEGFDVAGNVEGEIFFVAVTADCAFVVAPVARVEDHGFELAEVGNHLRPQLWLERFREIDARDEVLAVFFRHRETEPVAHAVDHHFAAVELHLERAFAIVEQDVLVDRRDAGREPVKLRHVINCEIFAPADLDDLPVGSSQRAAGESEKCEEAEDDFPRADHGRDYGTSSA